MLPNMLFPESRAPAFISRTSGFRTSVCKGQRSLARGLCPQGACYLARQISAPRGGGGVKIPAGHPASLPAYRCHPRRVRSVPGEQRLRNKQPTVG